MATGAGLLGLILSRWVVDNFDGSASALTAASVLRVVGQPTLLASSCLALVLQAVAFATIYGFTPVYAEGIGATKESLANLAFISSVPAILGNYLAGKYFVPRMGEVATATFSFLLLAVFTAVIPFTGTMAGLYATQAVAGFARGVVLPVLMSLSIKNEPDETRATAMGCLGSVRGRHGPGPITPDIGFGEPELQLRPRGPCGVGCALPCAPGGCNAEFAAQRPIAIDQQDPVQSVSAVRNNCIADCKRVK